MHCLYLRNGPQRICVFHRMRLWDVLFRRGGEWMVFHQLENGGTVWYRRNGELAGTYWDYECNQAKLRYEGEL